MKCYKCGKKEEITNGYSNIDRVETDLEYFEDEEEKYMPLCQECVKLWENGELDKIEDKWVGDSNKINFISLE
jgi:hypothetical protein